uniref:Uncharacterized protein n=1 Tax=Rhizophora mucronata TaxID=61149 RepID=A0A2P2N2A1_RHIMU
MGSGYKNMTKPELKLKYKKLLLLDF